MRLVYYSSTTTTNTPSSTISTTRTNSIPSNNYSTCTIESLYPNLNDDDQIAAIPHFTEEDYSKLIVTNPDDGVTTVTCDSYCDALVGCHNMCSGVGIYNATTVNCGCDCASSIIINAETVHCSCCGGTTIQNAKAVYCSGEEDSCRSVDIQANKVVECSGARSCRFSEIQASVVECSGPESCGSTNIHAQHVVCNGTCGATFITSACLECVNGGCQGHWCFWNGAPCPLAAPKTCVVGASVKATGQVNQQIVSSPGQREEAASNYTKIMVEVNVEANQRDPTLFHGTVQLRQEDEFTPFKTFDSTSILLSYVQKECAIIKGRGKVDGSASDKYEFSMKLCEAGHNNTMSMTIDKPPMRRYSLYILSKATLEGRIDVKYQNFDSVQQAAIF